MKTNNEFENFCRNVKCLRKNNDLTQREMAEILGVSRYCIQKLESGIMPPRMCIDVVFELAKQFSLRPSELFSSIDISVWK